MRWIAVILGVLFATRAISAGGRLPSFEHELRPQVDKYCFKCHDEDTAKGGVNLARFDRVGSLYRDPLLWEKVIRQLQDRAMPPEGKLQPTVEERVGLAEGLQAVLDNPSPEYQRSDPGRVGIHRLNKTEYNNTLRDLLGITNRPADNFPSEGGGGGGFDNNADTLFVPPILLEKYVLAADEALAQAPPEKLIRSRPVWYSSRSRAATENLRWFLRRAWRRPASDDDVARLLKVYETESNRGKSFDLALEAAYKVALVSPRFLYRIERDKPGADPRRLDDFELASRLSYFLWSSPPDDELLQLAESDTLHQPPILEAQVFRMLSDPKARTLAEQFTTQWLGTKSLAIVAAPDLDKYPDFTPALRDAMATEPVEFFRSLLSDNSSLLLLIDAPYTFANHDLAKIYGLPNVDGADLIRVNLPDRRRGGITGMAAVLTQTSYPRRTSPVLRGKWILEEVLGTPPPPPPPLVATLPADDHRQDGLTFRQQLEKHRKNANCAACHSRLDPLGFCLENFDGIGRWRDKIDGAPVDASGQMVTGENVEGPLGLKKVLLARKERFIRQLTEKMLSYALGRGLEYYDIPVVKKIAATLDSDDDRAVTLIQEVVRSLPFQYRRGADSPNAAVAGVRIDSFEGVCGQGLWLQTRRERRADPGDR